MISKKEGSLVLEVAVSLFILALVIIVAASIDRLIILDKKDKNKDYKIQQSFYSVVTEVKYNVNYKLLKDSLKDNKLILDYDDEFLEKLTTTNLLDMTKEKDSKGTVKILKISECDEEEYMELKIIINSGKNNIEGKVIKAYWMDYV